MKDLALRWVILIQVGFIGINILMAVWHSILIKKHKRIRHGLWATLYLLAVAAVCILTKNYFFGPALLFIRPLSFDPVLSLLRGLPISYTPKNPKSIIDKIENKIFGSNWNAKAATYIICFIIAEVVLIMSYA